MSSQRADMMKLVKKASKLGCTVERTGSGHWRITTPEGVVIPAPFSPSKPGTCTRIRRELQKAGVRL